MEVLRIDNVYKIYGSDANKVEALSNVNFTVKRGEFIAVMGPSGSGKSTLLHIIGGVEETTAGHIYIDGVDLHKLDREERAIFRRRNIGIVYQFDSLLEILNVEENISLPIKLDGKKIRKDRIEQILDRLNLRDKQFADIQNLSGGQKQRIAIARALINAPAILLADEPTGNLDSKNSQDVIELLKESNRKYKQTIILITHDEDIAIQADRIIHIDDGKILRDEVLK